MFFIHISATSVLPFPTSSNSLSTIVLTNPFTSTLYQPKTLSSFCTSLVLIFLTFRCNQFFLHSCSSNSLSVIVPTNPCIPPIPPNTPEVPLITPPLSMPLQGGQPVDSKQKTNICKNSKKSKRVMLNVPKQKN